MKNQSDKIVKLKKKKQKFDKILKTLRRINEGHYGKV
jgi:RNA polymerase-binding transcription factor DksA